MFSTLCQYIFGDPVQRLIFIKIISFGFGVSSLEMHDHWQVYYKAQGKVKRIEAVYLVLNLSLLCFKIYSAGMNADFQHSKFLLPMFKCLLLIRLWYA